MSKPVGSMTDAEVINELVSGSLLCQVRLQMVAGLRAAMAQAISPVDNYRIELETAEVIIDLIRRSPVLPTGGNP